MLFLSEFLKISRLLRASNPYSDNNQENKQKESIFEICEIKENAFVDLKNGEQGGAVLVKSPQVSLKIFHTLFIGCTAQLNGGAVFANCARFSSRELLYVECSVSDAAWSGQSYYSMCNVVKINTTSIVRCPISSKLRGSEAAIMIGGVQLVRQLNSSYNIPAQYAGGLATSESVSFQLTMSMFYHNESPNHVLALVHLRPDDDISFCNIVRNVVFSDGIVFISGGYVVLRKCVFRRNQGSLCAFNNAYGPGFLTIEECAIDVPERIIMDEATNLYNLGSTFTKKPSKNLIPRNIELDQGPLYRAFRFINMK